MDPHQEAEMAKNVSQMVRGLGMGVRLISSLTEEVIKAGGGEETLHLLTTEDGRDNLKKVAEFIVSLEPRIPKSYILRLLLEYNIEQGWQKNMEYDSLYHWGGAIEKLKLKEIVFVNDPFYAKEDPPSPPLSEIRDQIDGKKLECGAVITWNDAKYIVTGIWFENDAPEDGVIKIDQLDHVDMVPARFVELDK